MQCITSGPATSNKHIYQVDYIRAIASMWVALFHLGGKALPVLNYGWLGVQMFFLLSGFIICWGIPENYNWSFAFKFIYKRIIRIEPPYVISIVLAVIAHLVLVVNYKPDWYNIIAHFAYINSFIGQPYLSPVFWSLGIEFQFYLFIAIFFPLLISKLGTPFILAFCALPLIVNVPPGFGLIGVAPIFAMGMVYYLYLKGYFKLIESIVTGILTTACSVYTSGWMVTGAALFTVLILILPLKQNSLISFFSKISFSLYLTHDMVGSNLVVYMGMHLPKSTLFKGFEFLSGIIVSIAFAYVFYLLVEAPCISLSKRIRYQYSFTHAKDASATPA